MSALPTSMVLAEPSRMLLSVAHVELQRRRLRTLPGDLDAALGDAHFGPLLRGMAREMLRRQALQAAAKLPRLRFDARAAQAGDAQ